MLCLGEKFAELEDHDHFSRVRVFLNHYFTKSVPILVGGTLLGMVGGCSTRI